MAGPSLAPLCFSSGGTKERKKEDKEQRVSARRSYCERSTSRSASHPETLWIDGLPASPFQPLQPLEPSNSTSKTLNMAEDAGTPMDMADSPNGNDVQQQHADPSRVLEIPLASEELLEINLDELRDDDTIQEVAELFKTERTPVIFWIKILNEYYRRGSIETATRLGELGLEAFRSRGDSASTVPLLCMMASYAILHSRTAPKTVLPQPRQYHVKGQPKAYWHQKATALLNQADAIDNKNGFVLDTKGGCIRGAWRGVRLNDRA